MSTDTLVSLAQEHRKIFGQLDKGLLNQLRALEKDRKPAFLTEVVFNPRKFESYEEFLFRVEDFLDRASRLGYWAFKGKELTPCVFHIYLGKLRSVVLTIMAIDEPIDHNAGAMGLLLGYPFPDILRRVRRRNRHELYPY